jgi:dephospho-CoA kinase
MIKLLDLLLEATNKPKAIFLSGPAGSGKTYITKQLIPSGLTVINIDDTYEELLRAAGLGTKIADFSQDQLSQAAKLMGQAQKATKEKYAQLSTAKNNIVIDGTGAASKPLLKKKEELEALGYDTLMIMIWVSPYTSLERNAQRDRALPPAIVLRTWRDVNKNVETYRSAFGNNFILIDNDPEARLEYDPEYAKAVFFQTVKGSGKQYSPEEKLKKKEEIDAMNQEISNILKASPDFMSIEDAKTKINNFLQ